MVYYETLLSWWVEPVAGKPRKLFNSDQGQRQVACFVDQAIECGLITDRAGQPGIAIGVVRDRQAIEPGRPTGIEMALDGNLIVQCHCCPCRCPPAHSPTSEFNDGHSIADAEVEPHPTKGGMVGGFFSSRGVGARTIAGRARVQAPGCGW